jgi:two-component system response regulator YesN
LVMGGVSSADAIEQSQQLGLDILAKYYLVVFIRIELCEKSKPFDYHQYQQVEQIVSNFAGNNMDVFLTQKDIEELVLLIKSDNPEQLIQEGSFLAGLIKVEVENLTTCNLVIRIGTPQGRLGDIHRSFAEALVQSKAVGPFDTNPQLAIGQADLLKIDHDAIDNYLKFGSILDFDDFFAAYLHPLGKIALQAYLIKQYLFVDLILTATQFLSDLSGESDHIVPQIHEIESRLASINSIEQIKGELKQIFVDVLSFRNSQVNHERFKLIQQSKAYIDIHYIDPDLQMNKVARRFNLSSSHFSTIFRQSIGETFQDYVSKNRINRAKELLRTTSLKCSEIAYQCGYNDPHYFSFVFKKKTGLTPRQFRSESQENPAVE